VACDLPFITSEVLTHLLERRDPRSVATAYRSSHDQLPEPLCAIWEPAAREGVLAHIAGGKQCPRKFLINSITHLLDLPNVRALDNINTSDEFQNASAALAANPDPLTRASGDGRAEGVRGAPLEIKVQYYALFREQAGRSEESLETSAATPAALYRELQARYPFKLAPEQLKVAVNTDFRDWNSPLAAGDTVVFIPPVAGG
jgi:molybdopterin-guanine dinucleotide biosynthesis protein A